MLVGLCIVFVFLALGKAIELGFGLPIPGSIIGMLLLLIGQFVYAPLHEKIKSIASILQRYLALIYFPLGAMAVIDYRPLLQDWLSVVLAITLATGMAFVLVGLLANQLFRPKNNGNMGANITGDKIAGAKITGAKK